MRILITAGFLALVITVAVLILIGCSSKEEAPDTDTETTPSEIDAIKPSAVIVIKANDTVMYASFEDNPSAEAFKDMLNTAGKITLGMSDYGGFEKVGELPWELPSNDKEFTAKRGDLILYEGNKITIYYGENTWNFTKLASIGNKTGEELKDILGDGDVTVNFWIEWGE